MKLLRKSLSKEEVFLKSTEIKNNLFSEINKLNYNSVCIYLSAFKEPDTTEIIDILLKSNKKVCVPVTDKNKKIIYLSLINDINLKKGAYNIYEPVKIIYTDYSFPDLIIIPGIAFDKNKNRIGFGMGYYDKFLNKSRGKKIGLCYDFQLLDNIPSQKHDIKMDIIITEKRVCR